MNGLCDKGVVIADTLLQSSTQYSVAKAGQLPLVRRQVDQIKREGSLTHTQEEVDFWGTEAVVDQAPAPRQTVPLSTGLFLQRLIDCWNCWTAGGLRGARAGGRLSVCGAMESRSMVIPD
jgi:hypothetical protein